MPPAEKFHEKQVDGYNKFSYANIENYECGMCGEVGPTFLSTSDDCEYHHLRYCQDCITAMFNAFENRRTAKELYNART